MFLHHAVLQVEWELSDGIVYVLTYLPGVSVYEEPASRTYVKEVP